MNTILGIFYVLPWWLKIIVVLIVVGIPINIYENIRKSFERVNGRREISEQININPELALQTSVKGLESDVFTLDEYEGHLLKIAENTGYIDAMVKLAELYSGTKYGDKKDDKKSLFWKECAAKAGDLGSIVDYYGFSDYDISSDAYDEIFSCLDYVKTTSQNEEDLVNYMKGVVNYKRGMFESAKQLLAKMSSSDFKKAGRYMIFRCFMKESNISAVENMLDDLEKDEFKIPAVDYLYLYNYYVLKRENAEPDYVAEIKYVEKYGSSEEADYETVCRISGNTYYNVAVAIEHGRYGFEKNMGKSLELYRKAADFGYMDALYYVGMHFWTGEFRDYYKANEYLLKAAQKGHSQAEAILERYGVDGILIMPMQVKQVSYHFMDGYELTASDDTMKWLVIFYGIQYKALVLSDQFLDLYKKTFQSFDELVNGVHQLYADQVARMLEWGIRLLMSFEIDTYDVEDIMNESEDLALFPKVPLFEQALEKIDDRAEQLNMQTAYAQITRGSWSGAGFGTTIGGTIRASIKASVAAGAMNIGSGILHGIGDSIVDAMNNAEIKKMGEKVFANSDIMVEFSNAVLMACLDIGNVLRGIVETHCKIELKPLKGIIKFGNECLADLDERTLKAKINNNLSVANTEYAYALLLENLRRHPLDGDILNQIIVLTIRRSSYGEQECKEVLRYAFDFGLDGYATEINDIINTGING